MTFVSRRTLLKSAAVLGAYGTAMRTRFNGFGAGLTVEATDEPMATLYGVPAERAVPSNVVTL